MNGASLKTPDYAIHKYFMQTNATIKCRLAAYLKYLGIGQAKFAELTGLSKGFANNVGDSIRTENLAKICAVFPNLNTVWLLTGEGSMLKSETQPAKAPKVSYGAHIKNLFSDLTDEDIESLIAGEFAKHLLEMYEEGRAYPAIYVTQIKDELTAAQRRIIELEKEIEVIKSQKQ